MYYTGLAKDAVCEGSTVAPGEACDGSQGLVCGDQCYIDKEEDDTAKKTCVCGPYHIEDGSIQGIALQITAEYCKCAIISQSIGPP